MDKRIHAKSIGHKRKGSSIVTKARPRKKARIQEIYSSDDEIADKGRKCKVGLRKSGRLTASKPERYTTVKVDEQELDETFSDESDRPVYTARNVENDSDDQRSEQSSEHSDTSKHFGKNLDENDSDDQSSEESSELPDPSIEEEDETFSDESDRPLYTARNLENDADDQSSEQSSEHSDTSKHITNNLYENDSDDQSSEESNELPDPSIEEEDETDDDDNDDENSNENSDSSVQSSDYETGVERKPDEYVYRLLRYDESYRNGLFPKNIHSRITIAQHVEHGSKGQRSKFISCCKLLSGIERLGKYTSKQNYVRDVVRINISKLNNTAKVIDLTKEEIREQYINRWSTAWGYAKRFQEVILEPKSHVRSEFVEKIGKIHHGNYHPI